MTTIDFSDLPAFSTPTFQQDGVTITGSGNVVNVTTGSLGLGINDLFINPGESIDISFDSGAASGIFLSPASTVNSDRDNLAAEANLEAFDVNGNSLGTVPFGVPSSLLFSDNSISDLFPSQLISRFRLTQIELLGIESLTFTSVPVLAAVNDATTTTEDDPITFNVRDNDTFLLSGSPTLSFDTAGLQGSLANNGNGSFTYSPDPAFQSLNTGQKATTSFQYTLTSGSRSSTATVTLTITGLDENQPPTAVNDSATVTEGQTVTIAVLSNDSDPDSNIPLSLDSFTAPANGTVTQNPNGTLSYKANLNFSGTDTFTYIAKDSNGAKSNSATVSITVTPLNLTGTFGSDILTGTATNNSILGLAGNDTINGGAGDDTLTGGFGADSFVFASGRAFSTADFGVDFVVDWVRATGDKIVLSKTSFTALTSPVGNGLAASDFAAVAIPGAGAAGASSARIVFSQFTGELYYNENGSAPGLGSGGLFARIPSAISQLNRNDFVVIA